MKAFKDVSIRSKLRAIVLVTGGAGLLATFSAFLAYDYRAAREARRDRLGSLAQVLAMQSTAAVDFRDAKAADEILQALAGEPRIVSAALYGKDGRRLGVFARPGAAAPPELPPADGSAFGEALLEVTVPVQAHAERLGTVHLRSDLTELSGRLRRNALIMLAALAGSSLVAFLLCVRLEGSILQPLFRLAGTMRSVSRTQDFALRARAESRDETGALVEGFNEMLGEVEKRDDALRAAAATLERRVDERTRELRGSEERYRQLIELSPDAVLMQQDGRIVLANPAAQRLLRASSPFELLEKSIADFVAPETRAAAVEELRLLGEGSSLPARELRYVRLDGTTVEVEASAACPRLESGPALLAIVRDISQRKEVERLKNEFVSTVSHELRTPLTSIRASLGLLVGGTFGGLPADAVPMLEIASSNCERLVHLINDILDIEKIEAGKMEFRLRPVELAPLLRSAVEAARAHAASLGVRIVLDAGEDGARATADPDRLLQVLANLLSNAAKFSPRGTSIELGLRRREGRWRISIRDRGPGIPEAFRPRIFQKFAQADGSDTRQKGGTGLGLSICKSILERMGGSIGFEDAAGGGTVFHFELPDLAAPAPAVSEPPAKSSAALLVVEDDPDVALLLSLMLRQNGYRTEVARDAAEARAKLAETRYAAITLDVMLPDESGIAFLRELRRAEATRETPVVIVSAKADQARRQLEGAALEVVDWIEKPIEPERLMAAVSRAIRRPGGGQPRVLHVEDDAGLRETLRADLAGVAEAVGASGLAEARARLAEESFDLLILDVRLPDGDGLELLPLCVDRAGHPLPVLIYSAFDVAARARLDERIQRVLIKSRVSSEELREAVQAALRRPEALLEARP